MKKLFNKTFLILTSISLIACQTAKKGELESSESAAVAVQQKTSSNTADTEGTTPLIDGSRVRALFGLGLDLDEIIFGGDLPPILGAIGEAGFDLGCLIDTIGETQTYWENGFDVSCENKFNPSILDVNSVKLYDELASLNLQGNARIDNFRYFKVYAEEVWGLTYLAGFGAGALPYFLCARGKTTDDYINWLAARFPTKYHLVNGKVEHKGKHLREEARVGLNSRGIAYRGIFGCGNYKCFLAGDCDSVGQCIRGDNNCNSIHPNPLPAPPIGYSPLNHASPADNSDNSQ